MAQPTRYTEHEYEVMIDTYARIVEDITILKHIIYQHNDSPANVEKLNKALHHVENVSDYLHSIIPLTGKTEKNNMEVKS